MLLVINYIKLHLTILYIAVKLFETDGMHKELFMPFRETFINMGSNPTHFTVVW